MLRSLLPFVIANIQYLYRPFLKVFVCYPNLYLGLYFRICWHCSICICKLSFCWEIYSLLSAAGPAANNAVQTDRQQQSLTFLPLKLLMFSTSSTFHISTSTTLKCFLICQLFTLFTTSTFEFFLLLQLFICLSLTFYFSTISTSTLFFLPNNNLFLAPQVL